MQKKLHYLKVGHSKTIRCVLLGAILWWCHNNLKQFEPEPSGDGVVRQPVPYGVVGHRQ